MNPSILEASDDLTNLSHLNEPAVLQAIRLRYAQKEIYTYSGIVLIATNPFARVDSLYVPGMVQVYAGKHRASQAPHLFAIAEEAFAYAMLDLPLVHPYTMLTRFAVTCSGTTATRQSLSPANPVPARRSAPNTLCDISRLESLRISRASALKVELTP